MMDELEGSGSRQERIVRPFERAAAKYAFTTRTVPLAAMAGLGPVRRVPCAGDLVAAEVLEVGRNARIESRAGVMLDIFPGDRIVGAFGARYATDQFEGYVPGKPVEEFDLLSVGGVCGEVVSRHAGVPAPTRLRGLGFVCDRDGSPINQRDFGLKAVPESRNGGPPAETILVVGSSMNSGKTTVAGTVTRALDRRGYKVAAAKVTGTAAGKDGRFFEACGADPVLDFTCAGYPSTYMLGIGELEDLYRTLRSHLDAAAPDYVVLEIADGIFQRETRMMLDSEAFRASVDHVFFAAGDSLSVESGARFLRQRGLPLRAASGIFTQSRLASREAELAAGVPCPDMAAIMEGVSEMLPARGARDAGRERGAFGGDLVASPVNVGGGS